MRYSHMDIEMSYQYLFQLQAVKQEIYCHLWSD